MNKFFQTMCVAILLCISNAHAENSQVTTMHDVQAQVEKILESYAPGDVLVAFDIDMTLTQPDHPALYHPAIKKHSNIHKQILSGLSPAQRDFTLTLHVQHAPQMLVDDINPVIVSNIQGMGLKTMALTATVTGNIKNAAGDRIRIEHLRYNTLDRFNINFAKTFSMEEIVFTDMPSHNGNYPVFYKGILFTNGEKDETGKIKKTSKGGVLVSFLKRVQAKPKVIVMVDDRDINLKDIEKHLQAHDPSIRFIGIEYEGACNYAPRDVDAEDFKAFWQGLADVAMLHY